MHPAIERDPPASTPFRCRDTRSAPERSTQPASWLGRATCAPTTRTGAAALELGGEDVDRLDVWRSAEQPVGLRHQRGGDWPSQMRFAPVARVEIS